MEFPVSSRPAADVLDLLANAGEHDVRFREGRLFSLVYGVDQEHARLLADAYGMYLATNGLGKGFLFQSLGRFEEEVIDGTLSLLGASEGAGNLTSGGTESIIMGIRAGERASGVREGMRPDGPASHPHGAARRHDRGRGRVHRRTLRAHGGCSRLG